MRSSTDLYKLISHRVSSKSDDQNCTKLLKHWNSYFFFNKENELSKTGSFLPTYLWWKTKEKAFKSPSLKTIIYKALRQIFWTVLSQHFFQNTEDALKLAQLLYRKSCLNFLTYEMHSIQNQTPPEHGIFFVKKK